MKNKICLKRVCDRLAIKRGYCSGHYTVELHKGKFNTAGQRCSVEGCRKLTFGESQICWNHYRSQHKEGSKRWQKIKQNSVLYKRTRQSGKKYKLKIRSIPEKNKILNDKYKIWYSQNREVALKAMRKWRKSLTPEQKLEQNQKVNAGRHFGGWKNREQAIERDGGKCVWCGMTREEHRRLWNQDLHVDHKDNYGRRIVREAKNNNLDNLMTLCVRCHSKKSAQEQKSDKQRLELLLYGVDFTARLKEKVRKRDQRVCRKCGISERKLRKRLSIHHLDRDKKNNSLENLLSVCPSCHYKLEMTPTT